MYPGRVDTTLALVDWLFNFFLVFFFCYLLHTCLTVLNVFCKSTSLRIRYIYSLITFTMVYKFSNLNDIRKAGPILMLTRHVHNLTGKIIIGPNVNNFFLLRLWPYQTPLAPPYSTLVVPIAGPYPHHEEHSLTPSNSVPTCFLPAFPGTPVGCSNELLEIAWNVPWLYWIRDVHDLLLYFKWSHACKVEASIPTWPLDKCRLTIKSFYWRDKEVYAR